MRSERSETSHMLCIVIMLFCVPCLMCCYVLVAVMLMSQAVEDMEASTSLGSPPWLATVKERCTPHPHPPPLGVLWPSQQP
jgi:hypothetical protein